MPDYASLYEWSRMDAINAGEENLWKESHKANCDCARAIERAIRDNYWDNSLDTDCAKQIIREYGFNRVNFVLANTIQEHNQDGRFSSENKAWAREIYVPKDDARWQFSVESHPGLTDLFATRVQREYQSLNLFDSKHCVEDAWMQDFTGKVLVIKGNVLKDQYKRPEDQLFIAVSGFGCRPEARGTKVYGAFLSDGEEAQFLRQDFFGPIKDEHLPDWAKERVAQITGSEAPDQGQAMGGM